MAYSRWPVSLCFAQAIDHQPSTGYTHRFIWSTLMRRILLALLVLSSLVVVPHICPVLADVGIDQKRPFTFEDMMSLKRVGDPVISPDGKWVAFSAVEVDLAQNTRKSHLWVVPLAGGES